MKTAEGPSSFWQTTCSAIRAGDDPGWRDICRYREPLALLVAARWRWSAAEEREDLVHEILVDLREGLARRYDADRGPFRAFLCGVVRNKVLSRWKRARRSRPLEAADEPAAPSADDGEAVDVVADVVGAIGRWHDRWTSGPRADLGRVYVLAGRLVRGESYREIATREGISTDAVKRVLAAAREEIVADLLRESLALAPDAKAGLDWARLAAVLADALAHPRRRARALTAIGHPAVREALEAWLEGFERAKRRLAGTGAAESELARGLEEILGGR